MEYELIPKYDNRKSFYNKARISEEGHQRILTSYNTIVCKVIDEHDNHKATVYGTYSATTLRHIKEFLKQEGFKAETKKQIMNDYGVKDNE